VYACIGLVYVAIFILTFGCDFPVLGKKAQTAAEPETITLVGWN
jgi:TsgA-like MFS transporter